MRSALARAVALASRAIAISRFSKFAIGTNTGLSVHTPEQAVIAAGHRGIWFGVNEQAFPAQGGTQVWTAGIEAFAFRSCDHAAPLDC